MRSLESPLTAIHEHRTATLAADEAVRLNRASGGAPAMPMSSQWTPADRRIGMWSCYLVFALGLAYVPTMVAGFVAAGGLSAPIPDPYQAVMELLILLLAPTLVVAFAALYRYASPSAKTLSLSALLLVALMAGITICVHFVLLTVGRQANETTLPGFALLFSWTWPSMTYALDIAAWDFCLGLALLLVAPVFSGSRLARWVRYGAILSGVLCLAGIMGAVLGNMTYRDIGILGYGGVLPVVALLMGRLFSRTPTESVPRAVRRLRQRIPG
jgi:hypothetical protein